MNKKRTTLLNKSDARCSGKSHGVSNTEKVVTATENRPRNYLICDAKAPFVFSTHLLPSTQYMPVNKPRDISLTILQSPLEETWPGGALWDIGVLLAKMFSMIYNHSFGYQPLVNQAKNTSKAAPRWIPSPTIQQVSNSNNQLPPTSFTWPHSLSWWKNAIILELGCGVGLTGLAAAAIFQNKLTILTDLPIVIDQITQPNIRLNEGVFTNKKFNKILPPKVHALPLCWGVTEDEKICAQWIQQHSSSGSERTETKFNHESTTHPHLIVIGDVAYQHKPGAPSHFDALLQTLLTFVSDDTIVIFGTRMRMPASMDLLEMFQSHLEEVIHPPIEAHEIDMAFSTGNLHGKKHNITIHVFRKRNRMV